MPDLDFQVIGVEAATNGLAPLLQFKIHVKNGSMETVHSVLLHAQIQIQPRQRTYNAGEKEKLVELFGTPDRWGQTLRNQLWTSGDTTIGAFTDNTEAKFPVPCTYDVSRAATKYFYGLEEGDIPLLFLFSGTIFYALENGALQAQPIPWNKEAAFRMSVAAWRDLMQQHFPNSTWLCLRHDVFDRLHAFKRANGDSTWEQTIQRLLPEPVAGSARCANRKAQRSIPAKSTEIVA